MLKLTSEFFKAYYGEYPSDYNITYLHYNLELITTDEKEYKNIENDLKKIKAYNPNLFKIYISDSKVLEAFKKHTNILDLYLEDIYVRINKEEDLELLEQLKIKPKKIIIDYEDLWKYDKNKLKKYLIILELDTVNELSIDQLKELQKVIPIHQIMVGQICYLSNYFREYLNRVAQKFMLDKNDFLRIEKQAVISNDMYTTQEYESIYNELQYLVKDIATFDTDYNRFKKVYDRIIHEIQYDMAGIKHTKLESQNLLGGLLYQTCVCEGFAKILMQALSLVNVKSIVVGGGGIKEEGGHIWNQVCIDGNWYNADAAFDSIQVHKNIPTKMCLVSDDKLYYKTDYPIAKKCEATYEEIKMTL